VYKHEQTINKIILLININKDYTVTNILLMVCQYEIMLTK